MSVRDVWAAAHIPESILAFVGVLSPTGTLLAANQIALDAAGLTLADVVGKPFWECYWWSFDAQVQKTLREAVDKAASGDLVRYDAEIRVAENRRLWIDFQLAPERDELGKVIRLIPSGVDITDRKDAERDLAKATATLNSMFDAAPVGLGIWDDQFRFVRINQHLASINGLPIDDHIGRRPDEVLPELDLEHLYALWRRVLGGEIIVDELFVGETPASPGQERSWNSHYFPVSVNESAIGIGAFIEETTARRRAARQRELLVKELNHRVKNILTLVQSMAAHTLRANADPQTFKIAFTGRLQALAAAHDVIFQDERGASLHDLVDTLTRAYNEMGRQRIVAEGPNVFLSFEATHTLGLIIHELLTNALKYGALSNSEGAIDLRWRVAPNGNAGGLVIEWRESGGPIVQPPKAGERGGFGTRMIETALAYSHGGQGKLSYQATGVCARLELPLGDTHG